MPLGEQTAARFTRVEQQIDGLRTEMRSGFAEVHSRFAEVHSRFAEMRGKLDQAAAGQLQIIELLSTLIGQEVSH